LIKIAIADGANAVAVAVDIAIVVAVAVVAGTVVVADIVTFCDKKGNKVMTLSF